MTACLNCCLLSFLEVLRCFFLFSLALELGVDLSLKLVINLHKNTAAKTSSAIHHRACQVGWRGLLLRDTGD